MTNVDWEQVAALVSDTDWDHVIRISHDGSISEPSDRYVSPVYFDPEDGAIEIEHSNYTDEGEYLVRTFHPSEFLTPQNYAYHLSTWTDENEAVEFWLTAITDLTDSEPIGWAMVIHPLSDTP